MTFDWQAKHTNSYGMAWLSDPLPKLFTAFSYFTALQCENVENGFLSKQGLISP